MPNSILMKIFERGERHAVIDVFESSGPIGIAQNADRGDFLVYVKSFIATNSLMPTNEVAITIWEGLERQKSKTLERPNAISYIAIALVEEAERAGLPDQVLDLCGTIEAWSPELQWAVFRHKVVALLALCQPEAAAEIFMSRSASDLMMAGQLDAILKQTSHCQGIAEFLVRIKQSQPLSAFIAHVYDMKKNGNDVTVSETNSLWEAIDFETLWKPLECCSLLYRVCHEYKNSSRFAQDLIYSKVISVYGDLRGVFYKGPSGSFDYEDFYRGAVFLLDIDSIYMIKAVLMGVEKLSNKNSKCLNLVKTFINNFERLSPVLQAELRNSGQRLTQNLFYGEDSSCKREAAVNIYLSVDVFVTSAFGPGTLQSQYVRFVDTLLSRCESDGICARVHLAPFSMREDCNATAYSGVLAVFPDSTAFDPENGETIFVSYSEGRIPEHRKIQIINPGNSDDSAKKGATEVSVEGVSNVFLRSLRTT